MSKTFDLGQKVRFVRMQADGTAAYGEGVVIAKLIGVSKRINYSVRVEEIGQNGRPIAWNLEAEALDGTDEENAAYIAHHGRISQMVIEYDEDNKIRVKDANDKIEAAHAEFFGAPLDV